MKLAILLAVATAALTIGSAPAAPAGAVCGANGESCHQECLNRCVALYPGDATLISSCTDGCVLTECGGLPWPKA